MSHELRTPFRYAVYVCVAQFFLQHYSIDSSFYGLLDLLSGTELNPGQNEIG